MLPPPASGACSSAFHDAVLDQGPLPLDLLEAKTNAWIATQK
jgi:uncharacterized protein (DUF885 family)